MLARCSQPEIGLFGWREPKDELIIQAILAACTFNDGQSSPGHTPNGQSIHRASLTYPWSVCKQGITHSPMVSL